ncbi:putative Cyclin-dependent kinase 2 [Blattamonas nauphoetae]|uniref:Cyclin-dependent kinase 2 n=1 Tax=Blattamonas nauphoetae TaxID=2049346 RepID=A0ABQ9XIT0_9EUKA|nr:putative Cyclin-dependent kinase 2 [Blattamonas nauphoetae]
MYKKRASAKRPFQLSLPKPYVRVKDLGSGRFGAVYQAKHTVTGELFAIKILNFNNDPGYQKNDREINKLRNFQHSNVVRLVEVQEEHLAHFLVLELCACSLAHQMRESSSKGANLDRSTIFRYMCDILEGLAFLHRNKQAFGDLKPSNILISKDGVAKLGDFGGVTSVGTGKTNTSTELGTYQYWAPEFFTRSTTQPSLKGDMWSFGMILLEMVTRPGWITGSGEPGFAQSVCGFDVSTATRYLSEPLQRLLASLLNPNPKERCSSSELIQSGQTISSSFKQELQRPSSKHSLPPNKMFKLMTDTLDYGDQASQRLPVLEDIVRKVIFMIAHGITDLHKAGFLHRFLVPANVCFRCDGESATVRALVSNFSRACPIADRQSFPLRSEGLPIKTYLYMAPEVLDGLEYGESIDAWSLGCIAMELLYGHPPFESVDIDELRKEVPSIPTFIDDLAAPAAGLTDDCISFLSRVLDLNQMSRLSFSNNALLSHRWFAGLSPSNCDLTWDDFQTLAPSDIPQPQTTVFDSLSEEHEQSTVQHHEAIPAEADQGPNEESSIYLDLLGNRSEVYAGRIAGESQSIQKTAQQLVDSI